MPQFIRLDMFPATITFKDGSSITPVRVIVTDDTMYAFKDSSNGPVIAYQGRLDDFTPKKLSHTVLSDADEIEITKAGGCGCGSRLRGLRPFPGVPYRKTR